MSAPQGGEAPAEDTPTEDAPMSLMTLRVTRFRDGRVIEQGPRVDVTAAMPLDPYALGSVWPPCECPRHRGK